MTCDDAGRVLRFSSSAAFLPFDHHLKREPPGPWRYRPKAFWDAFEDRALFYDCFWSDSEGVALLVGPPPLNLEPLYRSMTFAATDGGATFDADFYSSRSTQIVALKNVPPGTREISIEAEGLSTRLVIQPFASENFADRNVVVTMNKDNDLSWITAWAEWHAQRHGADAFVVFDNGSKRYSHSELESALVRVDGVYCVAVLDWPHRYGRKDPAVLNRPHYPHFLQVSSLNVALRRFASRARGLLNCDVDELVGTSGRGSAFEQVRRSPQGLITLKGRWVETLVAESEETAHKRFRYTHRNPLRSVCANKWIIDPSRKWLQDLSAKPSVHRIYDVSKHYGRAAPTLPFWHFKAINTDWKEKRSAAAEPSWALRRLTDFDAEVEKQVK